MVVHNSRYFTYIPLCNCANIFGNESSVMYTVLSSSLVIKIQINSEEIKLTLYRHYITWLLSWLHTDSVSDNTFII